VGQSCGSCPGSGTSSFRLLSVRPATSRAKPATGSPRTLHVGWRRPWRRP
jgi:hypothetical protein